MSVASKTRVLDKNEILLIQPSMNISINVIYIPFGIFYIASSLKKAGYKVKIIDLNIEHERFLYNYIANRDPLYIGFSVFTGHMLGEVLNISKKIKARYPKIPIVWGGPHPTIMPELTACHCLVDIVCRGAGEQTAVNLSAALKNGKSLDSVPGITFKKNGEAFSTPDVEDPASFDNTSLGLSEFDFSPYLFESGGKKTAYFLSSRGCPYRCNFCWNIKFHGRKYMPWSLDVFKKEIQPLVDQGVSKILFLDSFMGSLNRIKQMGEFLKEKNIEWAMEDGCRVDYHCSASFFADLKENGCTHITFGAESGSQKILDFLDKDIKIQDLIRSAQLRPVSLGARYQWMVGLPGESRNDALLTVKLIKRINQLNPNSAHSIECYAPYPGCKMFDLTCEAGWAPPDNLEGWAANRWEGEYPHHKGDAWFYKAIQYTNIIYNLKKLRKVSSYTAKIKILYRASTILLYPFAFIRWKLNFFRMPVEYKVAEFIRRFVER